MLLPVTVSLKPAGNAPLLNKKKFLVEGNRTVGWMHQWLRKNLKCEPDESMVRSSEARQEVVISVLLLEGSWTKLVQVLNLKYPSTHSRGNWCNTLVQINETCLLF